MSAKNYKRGVSQHWIVPLGGRHADEVVVSNRFRRVGSLRPESQLLTTTSSA